MIQRICGISLLFLLLVLIVLSGCARSLAPTDPQPTVLATETTSSPTPLPTPTLRPTREPIVRHQEIGRSVLNNPIEAFTIGMGLSNVVVVGGIHGGYELNTIALAYELLDHFEDNPALLPDLTGLTVIPSANPDGQMLVAGEVGRGGIRPKTGTTNTVAGRFNHNNVDLNRNWDCNWQPTALFKTQTVSAGQSSFSEPETEVLRQFALENRPAVVIFLHSAAPGVFTGQCNGGRAPDTLTFASIYAEASGYPLYTTFDAYSITGDASDYLNTIGVASFAIELNNQTDTDFQQNLNGIMAVLDLIHSRE